MQEADYLYQIQQYQSQLSAYQNELASVKAQIAEAEGALADANVYSEKFYSSVNLKKSKGKEIVLNNGLKVLHSLSAKMSDKLTGAEFRNAEQCVQEIINGIKAEIGRLYQDCQYYENMIGTMNQRIDSTRYQLNEFRRNEALEAAKKAEAK